MPTYAGDALLAHAKAGCYRCTRGDRLVDMDAIIEGEGALAICAPCITDAAEVAGLTFNDARVRELTAERDAALRAVDAAAASHTRIVNAAIAASAAPRKGSR